MGQLLFIGLIMGVFITIFTSLNKKSSTSKEKEESEARNNWYETDIKSRGGIATVYNDVIEYYKEKYNFTSEIVKGASYAASNEKFLFTLVMLSAKDKTLQISIIKNDTTKIVAHVFNIDSSHSSIIKEFDIKLNNKF